MNRSFRAVIAICGAAILAMASAPTCAGWESTARERHDCCEAQQCQHPAEFSGSDTSQATADQCCIRSERGAADRTEQARLISAVQPVPPLDGRVTVVLEQRVARDSTSPHPPGAVPIYLLHSVFKI